MITFKRAFTRQLTSVAYLILAFTVQAQTGIENAVINPQTGLHPNKQLVRLKENNPERFAQMDEREMEMFSAHEMQILKMERLERNKPYKGVSDNSRVSTTDSLALVALYNATGGPNWTNKTNWLTGNVNTWHGIIVTDGFVTEIWISENNLSGNIPNEIGNLANLQILYAHGNQLTGSLPSSIVNLSKLQVLLLSNNLISGSIPSGIGNLTYLIRLSLNNNQLTGSIPIGIGNLNNLQYLGLNQNQLTGSIPTQIGTLTSLTNLDLYWNQLTGSLPSQIGNLSSLQHLNLHGNQLIGSLPSQIGNLSNLEDLILSSNQLSGSIPVQIGNLFNLHDLSLSSNQLTGSIPVEICNIPDLYGFYFSNNYFDLGSCPTILCLINKGVRMYDGTQLNGLNLLTDCGVLPPSSNAGFNQTICEDQTAHLNGYASNYSSILWTGNITPSNDLEALYTPTAADIAAGFAELCLTANPVPPNITAATDCVIITITQLPEVNAGVDATICETASYTTNPLVTNASQIFWTGGIDGVFNDQIAEITFYTPGAYDLSVGSVELCLIVIGNSPCTQYVEDCMVLYFDTAATSDAGDDATICEGDNYQLQGTANYSSSVNWTGGLGTFSPGRNVLNPTYTPTPLETNDGYVDLCLNVTGIATCGNDVATSCLVLSIVPLPTISLLSEVKLNCTNRDFENDEWLPLEVCATACNYSTVQWTTSGDGYFDDPGNLCTFYHFGQIDAWEKSITLSIAAESIGSCQIVVTATQVVQIPKQIIKIDNTNGLGISSYLDKSASTVPEVMESVSGNLNLIENQDGQIYSPSTGVNGLGNWDAIGYKANFSAQCCLTVYGQLLEDRTFEINDSITYLPVLSSVPVEITSLFADHLDEIHLILDWETGEFWIHDLQNFSYLIPGKAYLLRTNIPNPNFTIEFPQEATLNVTPTNQSVAASGVTATFSVVTNKPWHAISNQSWCTVTAFGTGDGTFTATFSENDSLYARVANITISTVGANPVVVTLTQEGIISTDQLNLNTGWNLVSFDVISSPATPEAVFANLITTSNLEMVTGFQNQQGKFFDPNGLPFLNTLTGLVAGEGYWVKVTNATPLIISGEFIPPTFAINLKTGWNLVAYWPNETTTPEAVFADLITAGKLQMVTGYEQGGKFYDPTGLPFLNTLSEIKNGFGYWVKLSADFNGFTYPVAGWQCGSNFTDSRDGKVYSTVQIGSQCWMKQNLNVGTRIDGISSQTNNGTIEKYCYNNLETNCDVYGGLYQWDEMMQYSTTPGLKGICPSNWHLPTDNEWTELTNYVGSQPEFFCNSNSSNISKAIAATTNWNVSTINCTVGNNLSANNATGLTILAAGGRGSNGNFINLSNTTYFWSSNGNYGFIAWNRYINFQSIDMSRYNDDERCGFSIRCISDY